MHQSAPSSFSEDLARVEVQLRTALAELAASAKADPRKPQQMARDLRLNRGLAWKLARIVHSKQQGDFIAHIPGSAGVEILLETLRRGGASAEAADRARAAFVEFDRVTDLHAGDRKTLAVMASQLRGVPLDAGRMVDQRRLAFQGNCGILGVRARLQLSMHVIAPNADDPSWVDIARCSGLVDLQRVRSDARWMLFRQFSYHDDGSATESRPQPLDPEFAREVGAPLLRTFCSTPLPTIEHAVEGDETLMDLPPGPVGNTGCMTCVQGSISRRIGRAQRDGRDQRAEFASAMRTPAEEMIMDVFLHRSIASQLALEAALHTTIDGRPLAKAATRARSRLPMAETLRPLGFGPAGTATPHYERYEALVRSVIETAGWDPEEFSGVRLEVAFPPIPTLAILSADLPAARA